MKNINKLKQKNDMVSIYFYVLIIGPYKKG